MEGITQSTRSIHPTVGKEPATDLRPDDEVDNECVQAEANDPSKISRE